MKDRSDDPSHNERTLLPRSYISFPEVTVKVVSKDTDGFPKSTYYDHIIVTEVESILKGGGDITGHVIIYYYYYYYNFFYFFFYYFFFYDQFFFSFTSARSKADSEAFHVKAADKNS